MFPPGGHLLLARLGQPLPGVLPHRLQQPVARLAGRSVDLHQRLVDQPRQQVEHSRPDAVAAAPTASAASSVQPPAKTASRREQRPLGRRRAGRSSSRSSPAASAGAAGAVRLPAGQQPEAVVQPLGDLLRPTGPAPAPPPARSPAGCRPAAGRSAATAAAFSSVEREAPAGPPGPLDEQPHRLEPRPASAAPGPSPSPGSASDGHPPGDLAGDAQRLAAGGQDRSRGSRRSSASARPRRRRPGARSCPARSSSGGRRALGERRRGVLPGRLRGRPGASATACGARAGSASGASSTSQTPSGNRPEPLRGGQGEAGLAGAAGAGQLQQPGPGERIHHVLKLTLAADQWREPDREPPGNQRCQAPALRIRVPFPDRCATAVPRWGWAAPSEYSCTLASPATLAHQLPARSALSSAWGTAAGSGQPLGEDLTAQCQALGADPGAVGRGQAGRLVAALAAEAALLGDGLRGDRRDGGGGGPRRLVGGDRPGWPWGCSDHRCQRRGPR